MHALKRFGNEFTEFYWRDNSRRIDPDLLGFV
ncbi:MAG: hypothetical protein QOF14_4770, partial [Hyphomicrobiales bacterium]|nr:hypothetical protein [Hyphomicrobiales bacterium]